MREKTSETEMEASRGKDMKRSVSERDRDCAHCVKNNTFHTAKRLAPQPQATVTITI